MKNQYEVRGETTVIFLPVRGGTPLEAVIDTPDLELADSFEGLWYAHNEAYPAGRIWITRRQAKRIFLYRLILNAPEGFDVDHINHNPLDNRRSNLRCVSRTINALNRKGAQSNSRSGIRGVYWDKRAKKWDTQIRLNGKNIRAGSFSTIDDARIAIENKRSQIMAELLKDERHVA